MPSELSYDDVPPPRAWLLTAFLGVWVYLVAQLLRGYSLWVSDALGMSRPDAEQLLGFLAGLGSILVMAGLTAALWRANLAAGLSHAGVRGLVLGAAGVGVLLLFEVADLLGLFGVEPDSVAALLRARSVGDILGTSLAFAGLASLVVGLSHATGLFARPAREAAEERREPT